MLQNGDMKLLVDVHQQVNLPKFNDKIVLCCGSLYQPNNDGNGNSYLIVVNNFSDNWYSELEFIEGDIQNEWNVT